MQIVGIDGQDRDDAAISMSREIRGFAKGRENNDQVGGNAIRLIRFFPGCTHKKGPAVTNRALPFAVLRRRCHCLTV